MPPEAPASPERPARARRRLGRLAAADAGAAGRSRRQIVLFGAIGGGGLLLGILVTLALVGNGDGPGRATPPPPPTRATAPPPRPRPPESTRPPAVRTPTPSPPATFSPQAQTYLEQASQHLREADRLHGELLGKQASLPRGTEHLAELIERYQKQIAEERRRLAQLVPTDLRQGDKLHQALLAALDARLRAYEVLADAHRSGLARDGARLEQLVREQSEKESGRLRVVFNVARAAPRPDWFEEELRAHLPYYAPFLRELER